MGRGYVEGLLRLGVDVEAISPRGFLHDPDFALPPGLSEISPALARERDVPVGLGFLHPPHVDRLLGSPRLNLGVWESDVLPPGWVEPLQRVCHLVVVPSTFTRRTFLAAGLAGSQLAVAPYGFDERLLAIAPPAPGGPQHRPLTFLAVLAPHWRKGVRELLTAYRAAFSRRDDVLLRIKSAQDPGSSRRRKLFEIPSWQALLAEADLFHVDAPRVELDIRVAADDELPALYAAADVVVAPTWGEAFGLAILEGLAAARPVVATGWGGQLDFTLPGPDQLPFRLEAGGDRLYEQAPGAQVAVPDVEALQARMRWHFEHAEASRQIGIASRQRVRGMTWLAAAQVLWGLIRSATDRTA